MKSWKNKFEHIIDTMSVSIILVFSTLAVESLTYMYTKNLYISLAVTIIIITSIVIDVLKK